MFPAAILEASETGSSGGEQQQARRLTKPGINRSGTGKDDYNNLAVTLQ